MKKIMYLIVTLLMLASVFTACNKEQPKGGEADTPAEGLTGSIVFATTRNDKAVEIQALADEFTAQHKGTKIEVQIIGDLEQEMRIFMSARELPDISPVIDAIKVSDLSHFYEPLNDLGFTKENLHFYSSGTGGDGNLYAIASGVSYEGIVYNKTVFQNAGVTEIPRTLEEFWTACDKIKALGVVPVASNFKDAWPLQNYAQLNACVVTGDGNYLNTLVGKDQILEEKGMLAGLNFLAELNDRGYLESDLMSTNWESFKSDIAVGRVAMAVLGDWFPPQAVEAGISAENLGMMPLPYATSIAMGREFRYAISNYSANKPLAKAFLKWLWEEGRYANVVGSNAPIVGITTLNVPWQKDLLSSGLPVVETQSLSDEFNAAVSKAQYDFNWIMAQEYVLASDREAFVNATNRRWADAQK